MTSVSAPCPQIANWSSDYIGIPRSASQKEIEKAYRKKSIQLHPDKAERNFIANRNAQRAKASASAGKPATQKKPSARELKRAVREAQEKYQRLTVIKTLLTSEGRARYDHFLKNGFPQWRSTGYYYERFRPGLLTTLIGLWVFCSGAVHYGILVLNHRQHKSFVERTIKKARKSAFGDESIAAAIPGIDTAGETVSAAAAAPAPEAEEDSGPEPRNRKERRMMEKMQAKEKSGKAAKSTSKKRPTAKPAAAEPNAPKVPKRKVQAANGKVLLVANDGKVYIEAEDEDGNSEEHLLDPDALEQPSFSQTALVRAPFWLVNLVKDRVSSLTEGKADDKAE